MVATSSKVLVAHLYNHQEDQILDWHICLEYSSRIPYSSITLCMRLCGKQGHDRLCKLQLRLQHQQERLINTHSTRVNDLGMLWNDAA